VGDVWAIELGMTKVQVRDALGPPPKTLTYTDRPDPGDGDDRWWLYPARKKGTGISWIYFGFDGEGRVEKIDYGVSLGGGVLD
jgi:hypothetical protein